MSFPRSVFAASAPALRTSKRQERLTRRRPLGLEFLEDRTLLSTWLPKGPAPILHGQTGGADPVSGRIAALAADPTNADTIYIAAAGGGVWKTTDGGSDWMPLTDSESTLFMGAIAVAPSDPNTIYAGTGEADNSGDSFYGRGILKSTDGGMSWTLLGSTQFNRRTIAQIVVNPTDPNTVYAAVNDLGVNGLNGGTGIWETTNGGATWVNTTTSISTTAGYTDVAIDALDPLTLYAAVGSYAGSTANGVYKTSNGGKTWAPAGNFPRGNGNGYTKIAIAPSNDQVVYASIVSPFTDGLAKMMKSVDGGVTWKQLTSTPNYLGFQGSYDSTLAVDPLTPDTVYAAGQSSILRSMNGGTSWSDITVGSNGHGPHPDHHGIGFDAAGRLLDGNDGGIWRLDNPTPVRWADLNGNLQITEFVGIALDPANPNVAFGGSQDNGTEKFTGSLSWNLRNFGDGGVVRIDFCNPQTVYHSFPFGSLQRSDNGGTSWVTRTSGINDLDPVNFYPPFVIDPSNSARLVFGTNRVYETTNRGNSWKPISSPNANGWVGDFPIDCLAVAPTDGKTIYAAAGGRLLVTTNDGVSWRERNIPGATDSIADLQVDPTNPQIAYAVRNLFNGGHIFRTANGGVTWTNISGNLPNLPAYTLAMGAGTLYVGNDNGVYASTDGGGHWGPLGDGLPHVQVRQLVLSTTLGILAAGTYGRGLWELSLGGVPTQFSVTASANPVTAGVMLQVTVAAADAQNNPISGYTGTVHFSSSDPAATLPGDYTFTAADAGVHIFAVTLVRAGSQTVTVADAAAGLTGSAALKVSPAAADHFSVSAPADSTAGTAFDVTVTALDPYNNIDVNYQGTVTLTTTDAGAGVVLPPETTFTAADAGVHTFSGGVTLVTAGGQSLTATDTLSGSIGTASIVVTAAAADHLLVLAPATVVAGVAFDVVVTVQDAFHNAVLTYLGTVQFTSSDTDPGVLLPPDYAFASDDAGQHTFVGGVILLTPGTQTLRVDDVILGITGQAAVEVTVPAAPPGGGGRTSGPGGFPAEIAIVRGPILPSPAALPTADRTSLPLTFEIVGITPLFGRSLIDQAMALLSGRRLRWPALAEEWGISSAAW